MEGGSQKFWFDGLPVQGLFVEYDFEPDAGNLVFTSSAPGVMVNEHLVINIPNVNLSFSVFAPGILINYIIYPDQDNLIISTFVPVASVPYNLAPNGFSLVFSTFTPEIEATDFVPEIIRSIRIPGNTGGEIILIEIDLWL